jgi:hypothetical protein
MGRVEMKIKHFVLILLCFTCQPLFAQKAPKPEIKPVTYIQTSFDIFSFFENLNPLADVNDEDEKDAQEARTDFQKLEELGYQKDEITGRPASCFIRKPFECVFFEGTLYLIDPQTPKKAILIKRLGPRLDNADQFKRKFANEVNQIEVEKFGSDTFRIFAQQTGEVGRTLDYPRTDVWDCDLKKNIISHYYFGDAFAKDLDKKGHRDVVVYDEGFEKEHWEILKASIFSWDGKEWADITDKRKAFLDKFLHVGYDAF